jgi:hypothetical protein
MMVGHASACPGGRSSPLFFDPFVWQAILPAGGLSGRRFPAVRPRSSSGAGFSGGRSRAGSSRAPVTAVQGSKPAGLPASSSKSIVWPVVSAMWLLESGGRSRARSSLAPVTPAPGSKPAGHSESMVCRVASSLWLLQNHPRRGPRASARLEQGLFGFISRSAVRRTSRTRVH